MITRNLQNVSKSASNSQKYALQHAHKCNLMTTNNKLLSNPISSTASSNVSVTTTATSNCPSITNSSLIHHAKRRFSKKTPEFNMPSITDIIPSNIKLSVKQQESMQQTLNDLSKKGQTQLIQLITEQLQSPRQPLQKDVMKRIKAINKGKVDHILQNTKIAINYIYKSIHRGEGC